MQIHDFLHHLHFDIDKVSPPDVEVDWEDAPLSFKLYQGRPTVALWPDRTPDETPVRPADGQRVTLRRVGGFLRDSYGITQLCHAVFPAAGDTDAPHSIAQMFRRFVPSGGGLYPSELYAYLKIDEVKAGVYHYDAAHHRLVYLREGNYDGYLERAFGQPCSLSTSFGVLFVSTMFWKNFFKYHNFSYRLQGLDAGALIGQLLAAAEPFGFQARVLYQFLDDAIHHLLGLDGQEESVYAAVVLTTDGHAIGAAGSGQHGGLEAVSAQALCKELPEVKYKHYQRSKHIVPYPTLLAVNEASKLHTTKDLLQVALHRHDDAPNGVGTRQRRSERSERPDAGGVKLPAARLVPRDFAATCRNRYSPGPDFVLGKVDSTALSTLLWEALGCAAAQLSEMAPGRPHDLPRVSVAFCAHGVDGIRDGAYRYHPETHSVTLVRPGDHRLRLQQGMPIPTVNLFQVPLCFHLVGSLEDVLAAYGTRGYRMLQMEVGVVLQRLLLSAAALGMNGHPLLGYDERVCDDTYHLSSHEETCLIQVPVGFYRKTARFEGTLQVW